MRIFSKIGLFILIGLFVVSCGFKPLHGTASSQLLPGDVGFALGKDRLAYQFYDSLTEEFGKQRASPRYQLFTTLKRNVTGLAITSTDEITRYNYRLTAKYRLLNAETKVELTSGEISTTAAYNATNSQYAALTAAKEVEARAAKTLAERIHRRMLAAAQSGKLAQ